MTPVETRTELRFEPPGPGTWELDAVHFPRPVTRYWAEIHSVPFTRGFREFTRYYGILLDTLGYEYVNGFAYKTALPVAAGRESVVLKRILEAVLESPSSRMRWSFICEAELGVRELSFCGTGGLLHRTADR